MPLERELFAASTKTSSYTPAGTEFRNFAEMRKICRARRRRAQVITPLACKSF